MNYIDLIIIVILIFGLARGFADGFVKEFASLLALILGIWGAIRFSSFTAARLHDYFDMTGKYTGIIAFGLTFIIIVIIVHFIGLLADKFVDTVSLGFLNRILGLVFGLIKNALILSVIFVILNTIDSKHHFLPKEAITHSRLYNPIADIASSVFPVIKEDNFNKGFDRVKKKPESTPI